MTNYSQSYKWMPENQFYNYTFNQDHRFNFALTSSSYKQKTQIQKKLHLNSRYSRQHITDARDQIKQSTSSKKDKDIAHMAISDLSHNNKVKLVREIELQISMLQSKSKQPGIKTNDLQPLGLQIYDKIDQYYINHGIAKNYPPYNRKYTVEHQQKQTNVDECVWNKTKSVKKSHRQRSLLSQPSNSKLKPSSSKLAVTHQESQGLVNRRVFKTATNLHSSVSSLSQRSINDEEMHIFQTKMSQSDLADLDRLYEPTRRMSRDEQNNNQSYIELKESIRVMEERITFLIYRLEENKKQVSILKQQNCQQQLRIKEYNKKIKQLQKNTQALNQLHQNSMKENIQLQRQVQSMQKDHKKQSQLNNMYYKQINDLRQQVQFLKTEIIQKDNSISKLQLSLRLKFQQYNQLSSAYRSLEEQQDNKKHSLIKRIQQLQGQKNIMRQTMRQYKNRLESEGLSFKFEQASKLKQLFEQSQTLHQRQIQKLDQSYAKVIKSLRQQLRKAINIKTLLQNSLVQWIGLQKFNEFKLQTCQNNSIYESDILNLSAIGYEFDSISGQKVGADFLKLAHNIKILQDSKKAQDQIISKYEDRIQILKQQCRQRFYELQIVSTQIKEKNKIIQRLNNQKQDLVKQINQHVCQNLSKSRMPNKDDMKLASLRTSKIQSKIIQISFSKHSIADNSDLTLQCFLKKKAISSIRDILKFGLKLIQLSQQLHITHKKKLPSLAPHCILMTIKNFHDLEIAFSIVVKKEEEEGLIYQAPQIILGFAESSSSHCWTIGVIIDELLHKRRFFKGFGDILSHKDNYSIADDRFRNISVLVQMIKKNHKQRISLELAKQQLKFCLNNIRNHDQLLLNRG